MYISDNRFRFLSPVSTPELILASAGLKNVFLHRTKTVSTVSYSLVALGRDHFMASGAQVITATSISRLKACDFCIRINMKYVSLVGLIAFQSHYVHMHNDTHTYESINIPIFLNNFINKCMHNKIIL